MPRAIGIGIQNFEKIITVNNFYADKTLFLKEWWESQDEVTLITRPGRFGKTLNMSMTERQYFFCASEGSKRFQADTKAAVPGDRRTVLPVPVSSGSGGAGK